MPTITHPLYQQAEALFQNQDNKKSLQLFAKLQRKKNLPPDIQQRIANRMGILYTRLGQPTESEPFFLQSLQLAEEINDPKLIYNACDNLAAVCIQLSHIVPAINYLQKALLLKEKTGNTAAMSSSLLQLSGLHFKIENNGEGKKILAQASALIKKHQQTALYSHLHFAQGMELKRQHKYAQAVKEYRLAIHHAMLLPDYLMAARSHHNAAIICMSTKKWKLSRQHLLSALSIVQQQKIKIDVLSIYTELARVCLALHQLEECNTYIGKAKTLAKQTTNPAAQQSIHEVIAEYYQATGQPAKALKHYQLFIEYHQAAYNEKLSHTVLDMQTKYETEKHQRQLREAQLQQTETELNLMRTQMNPHFVFNTINTIREAMHHQTKEQADAILMLFNKLMRKILDNSRKPSLLLSDNLEMLHMYIQLEQKRKEQPFEYQIEIGKNVNPTAIKIHGLLIQPLVENAIKHGLFYKKDGTGKIRIQLSLTKNIFCVTVTDNGIGRKKAAEVRTDKTHQSHATNIIRQTLSLLWKDEQTEKHLQFTDLYHANGKPAGTSVKICFPL